MPDESGTLRRVAWQEAFPWLPLLTRCFPLSAELRKLFVASLAVIFTLGGWVVLHGLFFAGSDQAGWTERYAYWPWQSNWHEQNAFPTPGWQSEPFQLPSENPLVVVWYHLSGPFVQLFNSDFDGFNLAFALSCGLWGLLVWSIGGGVLARLAALQLGREERSSLKEALGHAWSKWGSYFTAPVYPLLGLIGLILPMVLCGLLMRTDVGVLIAGIVWPLQVIFAFLATLLLVGLFLGWPLMWATIAAEESDAFDALSRAYGYVYQRPFHFLFYVAVASVIGIITWWLLMLFASGVMYLSVWSAEWGSTPDRMQQVNAWFAPVVEQGTPGAETVRVAEPLTGVGYYGSVMIAFWMSAIYLVAISYGYSYFWTASTAIYLLLRMDVDGTELDDIHVDEDEELDSLPPLTRDTTGLPIVEPDHSPAAPEDEEPQQDATDETAAGKSSSSDS